MQTPRLRSLLARIGLADRPSWFYALFSVALALLLWILTVSEAKGVKELYVPLDLLNVPEGMAVTGPDARKAILVQVKGPPDLLKRVVEEDVDVKLDLGDMPAGPRIVEIRPDMVRLPSTVEVVRLYPPVLHITLERLVTVNLPVRPTFSGSPAAPLSVVSWTVEPRDAVLRGPQSLVQKFTHVGTQPIALAHKVATFEEPVLPVAPDPEVSLSAGPGWVATVVLGERSGRRSIQGIPVRAVNGPGVFKLSPEEVQVSLEGPESFLHRLGPGDFRCEVDLVGLQPSDTAYQIKPAVNLVKRDPAARTNITAVSPHYVEVRVGRR